MSDKISIEAMISEIDFQIDKQRALFPKPIQRSLREMHEGRCRSILGTLRWLQDNKVLIMEVNKQIANNRSESALAPIAGISENGEWKNGKENSEINGSGG